LFSSNIAPAAYNVRMTTVSVDTRTAILDAAERAFAEGGLRGARIDLIAAEVGITKPMINYYFGSKQKLYEAVLERVYRDRETWMDFRGLQTLDPPVALHSFIRQLLRHMESKPYIAPLYALENIQNKGRYFTQNGGIIAILVAILERGMKAGDFRSTDPRHAAVHIMGTCLHFFNVRENVAFLWTKTKRGEREVIRDHSELALAFVLAALRPEESA
jgi:TetR/AcrR family transcriptional regulator